MLPSNFSGSQNWFISAVDWLQRFFGILAERAACLEYTIIEAEGKKQENQCKHVMTLKASTQSWYISHQLTHVIGQSKLYTVKFIVSGPGTYSPPMIYCHVTVT